MKVTCTQEEKEWLLKMMVKSDRCPIVKKNCTLPCEQCFNEEIQWEVTDGDR